MAHVPLPYKAGHQRQSRQAWHHNGKSRHERGYGSAWDKQRLAILERDQYLCQACLSQGRITSKGSIGEDGKPVHLHVDHKTPKAKGGTDAPDNLQTLCGPCHEAKTAEDQGHRQRARIGSDGWPEGA
ncbi:HNH endonuclease [Novosphingobium sp. BW1]|uniref:HNH endonuclease n=1 Tax=Novosphingobium sp. BW1 TaxID=2592621 RepID=UPI0011DE9AE8|nr:HNH endonuclease [Novosphingobium sp. BW1]